MAHLAYIGSHAVNGVSELHSELLRKTVFNDLAQTTDTKVVNKTNGITFRRWLFEANRPLTELLVDTLGERVLDDPDALRGVEVHANDPSFVARYRNAKAANKVHLANVLRAATGVRVPPQSLFDVHIKRIHEYKRQTLNILEAIALYQELRANRASNNVPRVKIFAGKAAASYDRAKLIIKLVNDVARVVNNDPMIGDRLKVVFVPNYRVSLAEEIIPAADVSEQISTAGMEASGTGNMKLALNGAITIGTLDGANIEMLEQVGAENMMIFGLTAQQVAEKQQARIAARSLSRIRRGFLAWCKASLPANSHRTIRAAMRRWCRACWPMTASWSRPTSTPTGMRSARSRRCGKRPRNGGAPRSSIPRAWAGSRRTARSVNMPAISGTCRSANLPSQHDNPLSRLSLQKSPPSVTRVTRRPHDTL